MKRNIQFNAWDLKRKKMIHRVAVYPEGYIGFDFDTAEKAYGSNEKDWPQEFGEDTWVFITDKDDIVLLQSSEVPDKNGNMMHDGHIVKCVHEDSLEDPDAPLETFHQITFQNGSFGWIGEITGEFYPFSEDPLSDCEIVGNIFENQELLKKNEEL